MCQTRREDGPFRLVWAEVTALKPCPRSTGFTILNRGVSFEAAHAKTGETKRQLSP